MLHSVTFPEIGEGDDVDESAGHGENYTMHNLCMDIICYILYVKIYYIIFCIILYTIRAG